MAAADLTDHVPCDQFPHSQQSQRDPTNAGTCRSSADNGPSPGSFPQVPSSDRSRRRVYVIDDDAAVLRVLEMLLRQVGYDVHPFTSSVNFLALSEQLPPGVVVTDQVMAQVEGTEVQRRLAARPDHFRVILITAFPRTSLAVQAMKAGAVTVLDKPFDRGQLLDAVAEGFQQLDRADEADLQLPPLLPSGQSYLNRLSKREREVIQLVYEGLTNKSIGIRLGISIKTVEKHRGKGMKKMDVTSLASLIRLMNRELGRA